MKNISKFVIVILFIVLMVALYFYSQNRPIDENAPVATQEQSEENSYAEDEHAYQGDTRISATTSALVGVWKSVDDAKFKRTFKADGTITDSYEGNDSATASGKWNVFTAENNPTSAYLPIDGAVYLWVETEQEKLQYKIIKVTPEELELVYLERGNTLKFTKAQ